MSSPTGNGNIPNIFVPTKYDPPELKENGNNYNLWSKALKLGFQSCRIWGVINGTEPAPNETTNTATYDVWCLKDEEAQLILFKALKH
jgi:hypothetical protein